MTMGLSSFLFGGLVTLIVLCLLCMAEQSRWVFKIKKHDMLNRSDSKVSLLVRLLYVILLMVLAIIASRVVKTYFYPEDKNIFSNVDYHVLSHKGFHTGDKFYLARGNTFDYSDHGFPQETLWDNKDGVVLLKRDTVGNVDLSWNSFTDPLYYRDRSEGVSPVYRLANRWIPDDVSDGFEVSRNGKLVYKLQIVHHKKEDLYISHYYPSSDSVCISDTSSFHTIIRQGYPLLDIIVKSPRIEMTEELESLFSGSYLVRSELPIKNNVICFNKKHPAQLCLMPSSIFAFDTSLQVNGHSCSFVNDTLHFQCYGDKPELFSLYSGVGDKSTREVLVKTEGDGLRLDYIMPDRRQLRKEGGRLILTSSIEGITQDVQEGAYLYNIFTKEDNFNHINALVRYKQGSARDSLRFDVMDRNNVEISSRVVYHAGEEFTLCTSTRTENAPQWIFEVENLRETSPIQAVDILKFIAIFVLLVFLRICIDTVFFKHRTLSFFELALYVVLLVLCVTRLIIGWRTTVFPPIEGISAPMYAKMRLGVISPKLVYAIPVITTLISLFLNLPETFSVKFRDLWLLILNSSIVSRARNRSSKCFRWIENNIQISTVLAFVCLLVLMFLSKLVYSPLERLCNITLPMFFYLLADLMLIGFQVRRKRVVFAARIWIFVLTFGYIFICDAGFSIVFLMYAVLQYGLLGVLYHKTKKSSQRSLLRFIPALIGLLAMIFMFLVLYFEGHIMIAIFSHIGWVALIISIVTLIFSLIALHYAKRHRHENKYWAYFGLFTSIFAAFFVLGILDVSGVNHLLSDVANSKAHMRYRAEIQQLGPEENIDGLILRNEFDSDDIIFIMRSAHNQWFINQYIKSGKERENFFKLQPHSSQGCTYTTQATDLVVTRYILAEHGERPVRLILALWVMLILILTFELNLINPINRATLGGPILLFVVSLMVYLSATNRIVFIGQDFPLISLHSRVAVIFPVVLLMIPLVRLLIVRSGSDGELEKSSTFHASGFNNSAFYLLIETIILLVLCMFIIEQKGSDQKEDQFNVSILVDNISSSVDRINDSFLQYQFTHPETQKKRIVEVWESYIEDEGYNTTYLKYLLDATSGGRFFASLLNHFEAQQIRKTDSNELLHLRRRAGLCYLAVNKKHYFIPAIMKEEMQWIGELKAAHLNPNYTLFGISNRKQLSVNDKEDFQTNILGSAIGKRTPNVPFMRFNSDWTPGESPLLLLASSQGVGQAEYFVLENDSILIKARGERNQIATAVLRGDHLSILRKEKRREQNIYSASLREDGEQYIARNLWLNGHRRLFYPLGKESMWSYHLANLYSQVLSSSNDTSRRDTTINLSLDYNLYKSFYRSIEKLENRQSANNGYRFDERTVRLLSEFRNSNNQRDSLHSDLYMDGNVLRCTSSVRTKQLASAIKEINKYIRKHPQLETNPNAAIDWLLRRPYDFSAVVMDGNGRIRLLFDYSKKRHVDPNNIDNMNKVISELYLDGSNADERDIFGCKALQYIPTGPGSTLKPVVYTAVTSQKKLDWKSIDVVSDGMDAALHVATSKNEKNSGNKRYDYYGGVEARKLGVKYLSIDGRSGFNHDNYIIHSNNVYHSVIVMLGAQPADRVENVIRSASGLPLKEKFPAFTYKGRLSAFNPDVWCPNYDVKIPDNGMLPVGLYVNFCIQQNAAHLGQTIGNYFGTDTITNMMYDSPGLTRFWTFPEEGSQNYADRIQSPAIRNGFNQMLLGSYPFRITPLQMAISTSRLVSLNSGEHISTLSDVDTLIDYEFFHLGEGWSESSYIAFMRDQVWSQMAKVPTSGTAKGLSKLSSNMKKGIYGKPYYLYCKTGTVNDIREDSDKSDRIRHLMVIITDRQLENVTSLDDLRNVRYYVMYLSHMGIDLHSYSTSQNVAFIENVLNSEVFKEYMNK